MLRAPTLGLSVGRIEEFGVEYDALFERACAMYRVVGVRDRTYLTWRYLAATGPGQTPFAIRRGAELVGWFVLETGGARARLVDLFAPVQPKLLDAGLQLAVDQVMQMGCVSIELCCTSGSPLAQRLLRRGFVRASAAPFGVSIDANDPAASAVLDPKAWHFTLGDHDADALQAI